MAIAYGARAGSATSVATVNHLAVTTTANIPANALIVVSVTIANAGDTSDLLSITDSAGNTYASGGFTCDAGQNTLTSVWYSATGNALASGGTVTVNYHATVLSFGQYQGVTIDYLTGAATTSVVDTHTGHNSQTAALWDTGTITTTNANDLVWVAFGTNQGWAAAMTNARSTPTSGWTMLATLNAGGSGQGTGYQVFSATGSYLGGGTAANGNNGTSAVIIAFKAAAGGGGTPHTQSLTETQSARDGRTSVTARPFGADLLVASDSTGRQAQKQASETTSAADSAGKSTTRPMGDTHSALEIALRLPQKALLTGQSGQDSLMRAAQKALADHLSAQDALTHLWNAYRTLSEAISGLEEAQKAVLRAVIDATSAEDTSLATKTTGGTTYTRIVTDTFAAEDLLAARLLLKLLGDAFSEADQVRHQYAVALTDEISGLDGASRQVLHTLLDTGWSQRDILAATKFTGGAIYRQVVVDTAVEVDLLVSRALSKLMQEALSSLTLPTFQTGKALYDVYSGHDALLRQIQMALSATLSAADRLSVGKVLLLRLLDQASLLDIPMTAYSKAQFGLLAMLTSLVASALGVTIAFATSADLAVVTTLLASNLAMLLNSPF